MGTTNRYELDQNGSVSRFVYDGRNVIAEVDRQGKLQSAVVRGLGERLVAQQSGNANSRSGISSSGFGSSGNANYTANGNGTDYTFYLNNDHGDVTAMLDLQGKVVNSYRYDAFGNIIDAVEKVQNRFKYAGEQYYYLMRVITYMKRFQS